MASRKLIVQIVGDDDSLRRAFTRSSKGATHFNRDISRATRGALAGSGAFHSLGRSIAFASGGFLAFASVGQFLRTSIDAAKEAQVTQKQLAAQFRASGQDLAKYQDQIDKTANRLSLLAGFENDELKAAFVGIFRASGDVNKSLRDVGLAADIARARHLDLSKAATSVAKVEAGNIGILRRAGVQIAKNATVEQALAVARRKFAGQARAGTTAQERFGAVLHNTEEIIGTALLPTLNKYLASSAKWLTQMNESGKLQQDVAKATKFVADAVGAVRTVLTPVVGGFRILSRVSGGTENALKGLATAFLLLEARSKLIKWGLISSEIRGVGGSAAIASAEVATLRTRLLGLSKLGPFIITIALSFIPPSKKGQDALDKAGIGFLGHLPFIGGAEQQLGRLGANVFGGNLVDKKPLHPVPTGTSLSAAQATLDTTFAQAKLLNPRLTRKVFDLGQEVARAFLKGTNAKQPGAKPALSGQTKTLSLQGRFNLADLALAQAGLTKSNADDVRALRTQAAIVRLQLAQTKTLKDRISKTQQLGGIISQIASLTVSTETKAGKAVKKHTADWVKLGGAIQAIPHDMRAVVAAVAGITTAFSKTTTAKLVAGLGLDAATAKALRARLSQFGVGGTVPRTSQTTAGGFGGATVVVHHQTILDGRAIEQSTTKHQQKRVRRNPPQKRGPNAGFAV